MRSFATPILLTMLVALTLAKPIPALSSLDEIERRWANGESEVCLCRSTLPGCYISAWVRSLGRSFIHSAHSHRDATPAWPVERDAMTAELSYDQRTVAKREEKPSPSFLATIKSFVQDFYRKEGRPGLAEDVGNPPVLRPRVVKYHFSP